MEFESCMNKPTFDIGEGINKDKLLISWEMLRVCLLTRDFGVLIYWEIN